MSNHLPKKTSAKIKRREKKRHPKMAISGQSVFKLKRIIDEKSRSKT
jgi:hypothetical protein